MYFVLDNLSWMSFNIFLALLGVVFGWMFFYSRKPLISLVFFILWVLFIPNTIYLITDLQHFPAQWIKVDLLSKLLLIFEYGTLTCIGIITFIVSMYPVDKVFGEFHLKKKSEIKFLILILVNLFIAFALVLGKYQRTHSWYVFSDFSQVLSDAFTVFKTPPLLIMVLFLGVVINLVYFGFKHVVLVKVSKKNTKISLNNHF